jgi:hypothetical protein
MKPKSKIFGFFMHINEGLANVYAHIHIAMNLNFIVNLTLKLKINWIYF